MANISVWNNGIFIRIYPRDEHPPPHFHVVKRGDINAQVQIDPFEVLEGYLPSGLERILEAWVEEHEGELLDNWQSFVEDKQGFTKIDPP